MANIQQSLSKDKLPSCASVSDETVQIAGQTDAVGNALQPISETVLGNPPFNREFTAKAGSSSHSSHHSRASDSCREPKGKFGSQSRSRAAGPKMMPPQDMLKFRLLCPNERVGFVIGKGGAVIKTLKHDTGCEIKILEEFYGSEDRVILIFGPSHPDDRISPAQDAVLRVQTRIAKAIPDMKGKNVPARLLVYSSQVGCLLGKSGSIVAEIIKFSGARICIGGENSPNKALEGDEIVQVSGELRAVQEALLQITTRLRQFFFGQYFHLVHHPVEPFFLDPGHSLPLHNNRREFSSPGPYCSFGLSVRESDHFSGPTYRDNFFARENHSASLDSIEPGMPPHLIERKPWFPRGLLEDGVGSPEYGRSEESLFTNTTVEVIVPSSIVPVIYGEDGACIRQIREISDAKIIVTDLKPGETETVITISGTPEQSNAAQSLIQAFVLSETEGN